MSEENVEVVRRGFEAFARDGLDATLDAFFDPDVEFQDTRGLPDASVYHGHQGVQDAHRQWYASWEWFAFDLKEAADVDETRVLATVQVRGLATGSGITLDRPLWILITLRRGKIVKWESWALRSAALEAVGLR